MGEVTSDTADVIIRRNIGDDDDIKAVFKRLMFVDVHKPIIKSDVLKAYESTRKRSDAFFAQANKRYGSASELVPFPSLDSFFAPPRPSCPLHPNAHSSVIA
jgi:hypothetical protein